MNNAFSNIPPVTKNLLFINIGLFVISFLTDKISGLDLNTILGLYYFKSTAFKPIQILTHMFMHGGFMHIIFNMYALFLFGQILERVWGGKRFLIYYLATGLGAAFFYTLVNHFQIQYLIKHMDASVVKQIFDEGVAVINNHQNYIDIQSGKLNALVNSPCVGASGAIFGLLLGFGMLFPETPLMIMFIPIPIKAKYFVAIYAAIELFSGVANRPGDNVAHFAHLGGLIFGFILIKIWQNKSIN